MHLPIERLQRREVVAVRFHLDPGQTIAAADRAGHAAAETAAAIFDGSLRDGAEDEAARGLE